MEIDIGAEAIDRGSARINSRTYISLDNPANASGEITSIEIWANSNITGLIVGTFYLVSGTDYKCRDSEAIPGTITAGSKVPKTVSLVVETGDFIGCYYTGGYIEWDTSGFAGVMYVFAEAIDPNDQATYTLVEGDAMSLKGIGEEEAPPAGRSFGFIIG